jgi:hypothetical protein
MGSESLGCFQFLDHAVNLPWLEANLKCEEIGGYLAEPRTARYRTKYNWPLTRIASGESIWGSHSKKDRLLKNQ